MKMIFSSSLLQTMLMSGAGGLGALLPIKWYFLGCTNTNGYSGKIFPLLRRWKPLLATTCRSSIALLMALPSLASICKSLWILFGSFQALSAPFRVSDSVRIVTRPPGDTTENPYNGMYTSFALVETITVCSALAFLLRTHVTPGAHNGLGWRKAAGTQSILTHDSHTNALQTGYCLGTAWRRCRLAAELLFPGRRGHLRRAASSSQAQGSLLRSQGEWILWRLCESISRT